jgi:hypothetical protein
MSTWKRANPPWLIAITDHKHGIALIKSGPVPDRNLYRTLCDISDPALPPQRSAAGGWIVNLSVVDDLDCLASTRGEYIARHERRAN